MNENKIHDVAIVGYGPVGQTLAILLGKMGYSVAVYERWQSLYPLPRAVFHDHEIRRVFRMMGLEEELQEISQPSACYQWFNADWKVLVEIDWSAESISDGPFGYLFNQPGLEAILDRRAKAIANVEVHQGWEVLGLSQDAQGCELRMQRTQRGDAAQATEQRSVRARYVIGADGANSAVRRECGIDWQDLGFQEDWLVVDLRPKRTTGTIAEKALDRAGLTVNKNGIPNDPEKPTVTSGVRIGTPAGTTRGFGPSELRQVGHLIADVLDGLSANSVEGNRLVEEQVRAKAQELCRRFPIYR